MQYGVSQTEGEKATNAKQVDEKKSTAGKTSPQVRKMKTQKEILETLKICIVFPCNTIDYQ